MADLQIAPARERSVLPAILIALALLCVAAFAVFYFNPHKVADLTVSGVQTFAPRTEMGELQTGRGPGGMRVLNGKQTVAEDDLYVVAMVSLADKLRIPIYLEGATALVTFADGAQVQTRILPVSDVERLGKIFPAIAPLAVNPIGDDEEIDPGKTRSGTMVLPIPGRDAAAWQSKKEAVLTISLRNQGPQTARLP